MVYFCERNRRTSGEGSSEQADGGGRHSAYDAPPVERKLHPNLAVRFSLMSYHDEDYRQQCLRDWDGWSKATKRMYFRPNLMLCWPT